MGNEVKGNKNRTYYFFDPLDGYRVSEGEFPSYAAARQFAAAHMYLVRTTPKINMARRS